MEPVMLEFLATARAATPWMDRFDLKRAALHKLIIVCQSFPGKVERFGNDLAQIANTQRNLHDPQRMPCARRL